jgi:ABC-2 type transport system permease protein
MLNLYRAEWRKALSNYKVTSFLVWIIPVGIFAFYLVMIILSMFEKTFEAGVVYFGTGDWTADSLNSWDMIIAFPANVFARLLPLAFMAVVIAGEYGWRTWKNTVPRAERWKLILAKLAALVSLLMLALLLSALISAVAPATGHRIHGLEYGPDITAAGLGTFLLNTVQTAFITLLALIILAGYAAISSLVTRSILGGLLAGFGISMLDSLALPLLGLIGNIIHRPELVRLYPYTPSYNLSNLQSWLLHGHAVETFTIGVSMPTAGWNFWGSALILALWIFALIACALHIFQQQELTE